MQVISCIAAYLAACATTRQYSPSSSQIAQGRLSDARDAPPRGLAVVLPSSRKYGSQAIAMARKKNFLQVYAVLFSTRNPIRAFVHVHRSRQGSAPQSCILAYFVAIQRKLRAKVRSSIFGMSVGEIVSGSEPGLVFRPPLLFFFSFGGRGGVVHPSQTRQAASDRHGVPGGGQARNRIFS
ncbi:hypothetical protein B0H63DRAFT_461023 [Podospora didyma]|uniref:Uncharacterized protein n=1 Tax=Podospora didyma TaxID=330526 RepID=A0AAE0P7K1_9PEZI|nr:hypothetical protein B0H63DRAFT_461023 [Podospora didyma]